MTAADDGSVFTPGADPLHVDALRVLTSWVAPSEDQERLRQAYVVHLERHPDGARRTCFPDHLTAGTIVLAHDGESVLLNLHRKARRWFAFGGHVEDGDGRLADTALREAVEESGLVDLDFDPEPLHLDRHTVSFCDPRGEVGHLDVRFCAVAARGAAHDVSDESLDVRWWPVDALPDVEDEMRTLIGLARARRF